MFIWYVSVPVLVDNDVNAMAFGEQRRCWPDEVTPVYGGHIPVGAISMGSSSAPDRLASTALISTFGPSA